MPLLQRGAFATYFEEAGQGEPVVLICGFGAELQAWRFNLPELGKHFRVLTFDNRGAGRSSAPDEPYSLEQMADDAIAVLDQVGVQQAHVVGASMGGAITQLIGLKYPERVISLTLACTACRNHPWRRELLHSWAAAANERGMGAMTHLAARWVIGPRSFRRLLPAFGWLGPLALGRTAHAFVSQVNAILDIDETVAERLGEVTSPTLVLVGNQDILTPRGDSEEIAERLPNAELVVISGAAHGFMVEHATTFNKVLFEFLSRVTAMHQAATAATEATAAAS